MYAIGWHTSANDKRLDDIDVYPNVFPDFDMALDCVLYEIKAAYGDVIDSISPTCEFGGRTIYHYNDHSFVIRKLFNFNPRGL